MAEKSLDAQGPDLRRSAPKVDPALARALACAPSSLRDAVISNISGKAYAKPEDLERDLADLESR